MDKSSKVNGPTKDPASPKPNIPKFSVHPDNPRRKVKFIEDPLIVQQREKEEKKSQKLTLLRVKRKRDEDTVSTIVIEAPESKKRHSEKKSLSELLKGLDVNAPTSSTKRFFRYVGTSDGAGAEGITSQESLSQITAKWQEQPSPSTHTENPREAVKLSKSSSDFRAARAAKMQDDAKGARFSALSRVRRVDVKPNNEPSAKPPTHVNLLELISNTENDNVPAPAPARSSQSLRPGRGRGLTSFPVVRSAREIRAEKEAAARDFEEGFVMDYYLYDANASDSSLQQDDSVTVPVESFNEDLLDEDDLLLEYDEEELDEDDWENQEWDYPDEDENDEYNGHHDDDDDDEENSDDSHSKASGDSDSDSAASSGSDSYSMDSGDDMRYRHYGDDNMDAYDTEI